MQHLGWRLAPKSSCEFTRSRQAALAFVPSFLRCHFNLLWLPFGTLGTEKMCSSMIEVSETLSSARQLSDKHSLVFSFFRKISGPTHHWEEGNIDPITFRIWQFLTANQKESESRRLGCLASCSWAPSSGGNYGTPKRFGFRDVESIWRLKLVTANT